VEVSGIYSAQLPDGAYVAIDVRQMQDLSRAFDGVSFAKKARLDALAMAVHRSFKTYEQFFVYLIGIADRIASRPAADVHQSIGK
jgi:hypothetical protein